MMERQILYFWFKSMRFVLVLLFLFAWGYETGDAQEKLGGFLKKGEVQAYRDGVEAWLDATIAGIDAKTPEERWAILSKNRHFAHGLAISELFRVTGMNHVRQVASTPPGRSFLTVFLTDREWLPMYLSSGPVPENTADGLETLREIFQADQTKEAARYRKLATAVSLVFHSKPQSDRMIGPVNNTLRPLTPLGRYLFFKKSHLEGKLRPQFDELNTVELRWVVVAPVENEALQWLQDNIDVPLSEFTGVCWYTRYKGMNDFGNTVQGPLFYAPSRSRLNWAEDVSQNGGVCGALSTFGTFNAQARGIPATTQGQPGHCAYTIRVGRGDWHGGFGGGEGSSHNDFWRDRITWTWLADEAFGNVDDMQRCMELVWMARRELVGGRTKDALRYYELAMDANPLNYPVWEEGIRVALDVLDDAELEKGRWKTLTEKLLAGMGKHPEPMCSILSLYEEKKLDPEMNAAEKEAFFLRVHTVIAQNIRQGWTPWEMPRDLLERQAKRLGDGKNLDPKIALPLFAKVYGIYLGAQQEYMVGRILDWGTKNLTKSPTEKDAFFAALSATLGNRDFNDKNDRRKLLSAMIRATEEAKSLAGFQMMSDLASEFSNNEGKLDIRFPDWGRLVSDKGLIYFTKPNGYDPPSSHRDILNEKGGMCDLNPKDDDRFAHAVVQLPETSKLAAICIVKRVHPRDWFEKIKVFVSTDEQSWTPIADTEACPQPWTIDLRGKNISARWIKVVNETENSAAYNVRNICVYAE